MLSYLKFSDKNSISSGRMLSLQQARPVVHTLPRFPGSSEFAVCDEQSK